MVRMVSKESPSKSGAALVSSQIDCKKGCMGFPIINLHRREAFERRQLGTELEILIR